MTALSESYILNEIEKAFIDNEIVPGTLNAAPRKILNVSSEEIIKNEQFLKEN